MEDQAFIPKIDISCLLEQDYNSEQCQETIRAIDKACRQVGFFTIINHHISTQQLQEMFSKVREFFYLPPEEKLKVACKKWNPESKNAYRGYFPSTVHGKQGMDIQDPQMKTIPQKFSKEYLYEINHFPIQLSENWNQIIESYFTKVYKIAIALTKAIFYAFQKQEKWPDFQNIVARPYHLSTLRFNYYPKKQEESQAIQISAEDGAKLACETHVDSSIFTILSQDSIGGLQVKGKDQKWKDVPYDKDAFVINTGRVTELITNGAYKPTFHRVTMNYHERISIPFFFEPAGDGILDPLILNENGGNTEYQTQSYGVFIKQSLKKFKEYQREENN